MVSRPLTLVTCGIATAASFFTLGVIHARRLDRVATASYDERLAALQHDLSLQRTLWDESNSRIARLASPDASSRTPSDPAASRAQLVSDIKQQLRAEMGLLPLSLLRESRSSFVELHSYDSEGGKSYGTAGYLGHGYFITVKHAVIALGENAERPGGKTITSLRIVYKGKELSARVVDSGNARVEMDKGDWALIRTTELDLPALRTDTGFSYEFAEPIFRLGNDYSKGIVVSTGYVGQRTSNGLVTCLTDGHPGVSGGGVLDQRGTLVGIPVGRMQDDYRFSFILPIRAEMLRKLPPPSDTSTLAITAASH